MQKTLAMFKTSLMDVWQYQFSGFIWSLTDLATPMIMVFYWMKVFDFQNQVAGKSEEEIIAYYLASATIAMVLIAHPEHGIAYNILQGELQNHLLKPRSFFLLLLVYEFAYKVNRILYAGPLLLLYIFYILNCYQFALPFQFSLVLILSLVLSFTIIFLVKFCIGLLAFWFTEIEWLIGLDDLFTIFVSGLIVPVYFFPLWLQDILNFLPFRFYLFFPVQVLLGELSTAQIISSLLVEFVWIGILALLLHFLWRKGLQKYAAYGG